MTQVHCGKTFGSELTQSALLGTKSV